MKARTQTIFLSIIIFLFIILIAGASYYFAFLIPGKVIKMFGEPSTELDRSGIILLSSKLFFKSLELLEPQSGDSEQKIFIIHPGETATEIASSLKDEGLIREETVFVDLLRYKGIDHVLQSGIYLIANNLTPLQIINIIHDDDPSDVTFSFPAGWRVEEIARLLPSSGIEIDPDEFVDYVKQPGEDVLKNYQLIAPSLEGFLFPGSYEIQRNTTIREFAFNLTSRFHYEIPPGYEKRVIEKGLSIWEAVIIASIIEKETILDDEAPLIASVFYNRLINGMPLQSDPTVQYALGYQEGTGSWWKNPLTSADIEVESPYNTYLFWGLPPTAICNPGLNSLLAVANTPETEFLYFRSTCDGSGRHVFSRTYAEHLAAECE